MKRTIGGEAVKAGDARLVSVQLPDENGYPGGEVRGCEFGGVGRGTLHYVSEAYAEAWKLGVMLGKKLVEFQLAPHWLAQP